MVSYQHSILRSATSPSNLGIKLNDLRDALNNQAKADSLCVDNTEFLVDERSRAGLDVPQVEIENGMVRTSKTDLSTGVKVALDPCFFTWLSIAKFFFTS